MIELAELNALSAHDFVLHLASIFEHSPWVPEHIAGARPFASSIELHGAMCAAVMRADESQQLTLIKAHPQLAGRAAVRGELTAASSSEQQGAGLSACTPQQVDALQSLNDAYNARFGFPFILAVKGHTPDSVIAAMRRRVLHDAGTERGVALREICRIARFRIAALITEPLGSLIIAMADDLATMSEQADALTCSYMTPTHIATAARILDFMLAANLAAHIDAVGNVVGVLQPQTGISPSPQAAQRLLTGSHYDTVVNGGRYDGRLGVVMPIAVTGAMTRAGIELPYPVEIIAFADEEGVRFNSTFLGSRALAGRFDLSLLDNIDAQGITMRSALEAACGSAGATAATPAAAIPAIARNPAQVAAFVEVHIEQGPVLLDAGIAVGVVTGIAGSVRSLVVVEGLSGHAGTVPMALRHDAAAAAAEIVLAVESRCAAASNLVGTVGQLSVPGGSINVIPGRCELSIDLRSPQDSVRDAAAADISATIEQIAKRRGVTISQRRVLEAQAVPCTSALQDALAHSIERVTGAGAIRLPSGAGHDAMMMASIAPIGMLFVRCGNGGISHHPMETLSAEDSEIAAQVFRDFLQRFGTHI